MSEGTFSDVEAHIIYSVSGHDAKTNMLLFFFFFFFFFFYCF